VTTNRKITLGITALIVGSLAVASSTPASARPPTRFDVCSAILSQRICDLLRTPERAGGNGASGSPSTHR
jgi:hypothetical protein